MLVCMRTTMNLPDSLMRQVRARADSAHRTVTSLVEQALRELLARDQDPRESEELLPTYGSPGTRPLVDIDDRDQLYAALDAERLR
jgi:plasmid stability protein